MRSLLMIITLMISIGNIKGQQNKTMKTNNIEIAIFANGCFWCTEAVFLQLDGVSKVESGYIGGEIPNPSYNEICTGTTGHAEAIKITFDADKISFISLLDVFFATHDPTTLNRQGNDAGTQYRSAVFYQNEKQRALTVKMIEALENAGVFEHAIVTEIAKDDTFYPAENYHQNYYNNNKTQGYCMAIINPKLEKFRKHFKELLKED
ncbi:MAG: peptide-methionine (S)-S-oxide reductase [Flavobacteriaceae bacterium]|nr:MAG: peptide-methionine (S)-S-oxide reductase [Flavobacteriaceae bacterium]